MSAVLLPTGWRFASGLRSLLLHRAHGLSNLHRWRSQVAGGCCAHTQRTYPNGHVLGGSGEQGGGQGKGVLGWGGELARRGQRLSESPWCYTPWRQLPSDSIDSAISLPPAVPFGAAALVPQAPEEPEVPGQGGLIRRSLCRGGSPEFLRRAPEFPPVLSYVLSYVLLLVQMGGLFLAREAKCGAKRLEKFNAGLASANFL